MNRLVIFICVVASVLLFVSSCRHQPLTDDTSGNTPTQSITCNPDTIYFQQKVLPIFISNCTQGGCHDAISREGDVILDNYDNIIRTGKIRAFDANNSKAYKKIMENNPNDRMPPAPMPALTQEQKNIVYQWIMQGAKNNSCQGSCDSAVFTYSAAIKPMINAYCQGCHSASALQGGIDLSSHAAVKARITDGKLWGSVNHLPGYSAMPKNGPKLSSCEIGQLQKWVAAGAPNN